MAFLLIDFDVVETSDNFRGLIDPQEYAQYFKQHLPNRILAELNREFEIMAEHAKQRLLQIVQEQSAETMKGFLHWKGIAALPAAGLDTSNPVNDDASVWGHGLFGDFDIFSQNAPLYGLSNSSVVFPWPSDCGKEPADSTYGSNNAEESSMADA